ncbi:universal stress protein [Sphingomonas oryzagri]
MKNILVLSHEDRGQEARLQAALDLTRIFNGHLTCVDVVEVPVLSTGPWSGIGHGVLVAEAQHQDAEHRARIRSRLAQEDIAWNWLDMSGEIATCLADVARLSDLIVASAHVTGFLGLDEHHVAADVVVKARTPVLAVPDNLPGFDPTDAAIIAWDGSDHAAAALRAAIPLLRRSSHVVLVEIDDGSIETAAEHAAAYLSRHGIHPTVHREDLRLDTVVKTVLDAVAHHNARYVVMGAFHHWRVTESVFGGVTRNMLEKSPVPLFMAH